MSIDIKALAAKAGVSVATVSRALNRPEMVQPATREKILALVKELGYAPNPLAQGLSTGKTNLIALVVPTLNNSYFGQLADGCQRYLIQAGYNLVIFSSQEYEQRELTVLSSMEQRRFDGLLLSGSGFFPNEYRSILDLVKIPVVLIEHLPEVTDISSVYIDDAAGTAMAIRHLLNQGHSQIGVIAGNQKILTTTRRLQAVKATLRQNRLPLANLKIAYGEFDSLESGAGAMQKLLKGPSAPTAVFAFNDVLAIGALKAALQAGLRVPQDLAVIGFDDIPMAAYCTPALSTIHSPSLDLGQQAARLLLERINNEAAPLTKMLLPIELVIRETC